MLLFLYVLMMVLSAAVFWKLTRFLFKIVVVFLLAMIWPVSMVALLLGAFYLLWRWI